MININERVKVLNEALPYLQKFHEKTIVIKYGGNAMVTEELKQAVMSDIVLLSLLNINIVLVHGGGPEINYWLDKVGKETHFVDGLRYTDEETIDIVQMVLSGKVNKNLVSLISENGGRAIGLSGLDDKMITCYQKDEKYGLVGEVSDVNIKPIVDVIDKGYIPIIATVGTDENGQVYNINADTATQSIASALKAEKLIIMTDTKGVLLDINDDNSLIKEVKLKDVKKLKEDKVISGGMIPKVDCCINAVLNGVNKAHIIDGRIEHSILIELLTDDGVGTMFYIEQ